MPTSNSGELADLQEEIRRIRVNPVISHEIRNVLHFPISGKKNNQRRSDE